MQEEGGEHPKQGKECPVGLVVRPEEMEVERIGDHVGQVHHAVDQEEQRTLPPPSSWSEKHLE